MPEEESETTQMNYRLYYKLKKAGIKDSAAEEAAIAWAEYESRTPWGRFKAFVREKALWLAFTVFGSLFAGVAAKFEQLIDLMKVQ